jgi:Ca2+-transporting ATPase
MDHVGQDLMEPKPVRPVRAPWASPWEDVARQLGTPTEHGLTAFEVRRRLRENGPNLLREVRRDTAWAVLLRQFRGLIVGLLVLAAAVSFAFGDATEGFAIIAVVVINATIGLVTELRAGRSMEALRRLTLVTAKVRRDGHVVEIPAEELVAGDMVVLEGGDIVTADLRVVRASRLQTDESTLTGESLPAEKSAEPTPLRTVLADRSCMLYSGTSVTRGSVEAVVVATGMETELGRISALVEEAEQETTPLQKRLDRLGRSLIGVSLAIAAAVATAGMLQGKQTFLMIETAIALAVAAIPEGLPIVATIALARGMWRMARRNALINRLSAVETLGSTTVIFTDKTGTLTENRMAVTEIHLPTGDVAVQAISDAGGGPFRQDGKRIDPGQHAELRRALEVAVLCNNASLGGSSAHEDSSPVGDPAEVALLEAGALAGIDRADLVRDHREVREEAFDPQLKMMATYHECQDRIRIAVKGAPESVLDASSEVLVEGGTRPLADADRKAWRRHNEQMAERGLRVLALATKTVESKDASPYESLALVALAGLVDPPRTDVGHAIDACRAAGVRVIMVTGDQPVTARRVALAVGLVEEDDAEVVHGSDLSSLDCLPDRERHRFLRTRIFARVSPEHKLNLIDLHQKEGAVVAMTGDGVNDAPALREADIGIAMGRRGTQVAREAADMILQDDAFSTIVFAIGQGRVIFNNIRRFVVYLMSCNVSEVMAVALASVVNAPLPILPLQILFLNLVTDVFPALALGVGEGDRSVMSHPPRDPKERILTRRHWRSIAGHGAMITLSVLGALGLAHVLLGMTGRSAVTVSFLTLAFAQLWHVFNMRDRGSGVFRNDVVRNPFVWGSLALCSGLLLAAVYVPGLSTVLKLVNPGTKGWGLVIGMSLLPLVVGQATKGSPGSAEA